MTPKHPNLIHVHEVFVADNPGGDFDHCYRLAVNIGVVGGVPVTLYGEPGTYNEVADLRDAIAGRDGKRDAQIDRFESMQISVEEHGP